MEVIAQYKGKLGMFRDILEEGEKYLLEIVGNKVSVFTYQFEHGHVLIDVPKEYLVLSDFVKDWDKLEVLENG